MALTAKQEAFAQAVAGGMTQADAYRASYDCENSIDETIYSNSSQLMADTKVAQRVSELKNALAETAIWTRIDSLEALSEIAKGAEARANEKVSAIKDLNALQGFNAPTKHEITGTFNVNVHFD